MSGNAERIPTNHVHDRLRALNGWRTNAEVTAIRKEFEFENFHQTMAFVNAVAWIAHGMDHHPDLTVGYNTCGITYTTHAKDGLTELDFTAASRVEALLNS